MHAHSGMAVCYESALCPPVCHPPAAFFWSGGQCSSARQPESQDQQGPAVIKEFFPFDLCLPCANFDKLTIILPTACLGRMEWCIVNNYLHADHTKYRAIKQLIMFFLESSYLSLVFSFILHDRRSEILLEPRG